MATNTERFLQLYTVKLVAAIKRDPDAYFYQETAAPAVAAKMVRALAQGTGNKNSSSIRATCRELGIPYTYAAIASFLKG